VWRCGARKDGRPIALENRLLPNQPLDDAPIARSILLPNQPLGLAPLRDAYCCPIKHGSVGRTICRRRAPSCVLLDRATIVRKAAVGLASGAERCVVLDWATIVRKAASGSRRGRALRGA